MYICSRFIRYKLWNYYTSCNVRKNNVCIVNLSSVSILSVYNVGMRTEGNVGK